MKLSTPAEREHAWRFRAVAIWLFIGLIVLLWVAVQAFGIVGQAVELLLLGSIIGFICGPITNFLEDHKLPRGIAALIALLIVCVALFTVMALLIGPLLRELTSLLQNVPSYFNQIQNMVFNLWNTYGTSDNANIQSIVNSIVQMISSAATSIASDLARQISSGIITNLTVVATHSVTFLLSLILAYWIAKDYPRMMREVALIAGPKNGEDVVLMLAVLSRSMGGYMRGTFITSVVNGVLVAIGLTFIDHPYAGLMGIATFILHFIPVVGPFISGLTALILALFVDPIMALWTFVICMVAQNATDNILSPLVMRSTVKIHPALSLVGIIIGSSLAGVVGMILAIPLTAAAKSLFVYYFETHTGRQIVSQEGALFNSRPFNSVDGTPIPLFDALDNVTFVKSSRLLNSIQTASEEAKSNQDYSMDNLQDTTKDASKDAISSETTTNTTNNIVSDSNESEAS